jgi:dTDP-4-amino-4,6-dideoxygalactose transaminase
MEENKLDKVFDQRNVHIAFSPPDISNAEIDEIVAALRSGWITTGPRTKLFEKNIAAYCGLPSGNAVCLNSATAALELALQVLGIGPGDEVITSAYTYTASASVIDHVGATIRFVDCGLDSYEIDYNAIIGAINEKTKAIIPVDIGGVMVDYDKIFAAVASRKECWNPKAGTLQEVFDRVVVIADAAHSFGASFRGKVSGSVADFSCFSFHAVKNLTTAEGGAVTWIKREGLDDKALYDQFQLLSLHGQNKDAAAKLLPGAWEYDIICTGYKCNMTDLAAAFGLKQLERFNGLIERRKRICEIYDSILHPVDGNPTIGQIARLNHICPDKLGNYHLYLARISGITEIQRNEIIMAMALKGVACNVHFKPLPMMTAYKNLGFKITDYPNAYNQFANEITLPMHTLITDEEAVYVAETFNACIDAIAGR